MQKVPSEFRKLLSQVTLSALILTSFALVPTLVRADDGDDNPTGVGGIYNGNVTDGGNWDPYTGNVMRVVDDIVVPGSVGAYPLKWTRYWNSRNNNNWTYSYKDYGTNKFPDGRQFNGSCASGIEELGRGGFIQPADGGQVFFEELPWNTCYPDPSNPSRTICEGSTYFLPTAVADPYGQTTTMTYLVVGQDPSGNPVYRLDKVTEPGGRYLQLSWKAQYPNTGFNVISRVEANDGQGNITQWVNYTWSADNSELQRVDYADGTSAYYTYASAGGSKDLMTADDVRAESAMRQIQYEYVPDSHGPTHKILKERNFVTGEIVTQRGSDGIGGMTETRGDGASRSFVYAKLQKGIDGICLQNNGDGGKLTSYTDFLGHTTTITYIQGDPDTTKNYGFIQSVTDPNGHTTTYERQTNGWGIKTITRSVDGSAIRQTFWPVYGFDAESSPWYLASRTDELGHTTTYNRDAKYRITDKYYPDNGYEHFDYNAFGEVVTHIRKRDASTNETEAFVYDARGLKTSYTDAMGGTTTYSYYPSGPWSDRLQTVTYPMNASGQQASETYEYDRDTGGNPIAGRGLVTKITHADGNYVSNAYNKYGDLVSTADELGHATTHTYDDYGRLLTTTTPLIHTTINSYIPTGKASSEITTSKLPFSMTLPSGKQTTFEYDGNWRKIAVHVAPGTADASTTQYVYDVGTRPDGSTNIGLLTSTIDPKNNPTTYTYDVRDRQTSTTDALSHTSSVAFDLHGNKLTETHANGELIEYDQYDAMNRLLHKKVHRDDTTTPPTIDQTSSIYDLAGNLFSHTDENGHVYGYDYDAMNRPTQITYPNTQTEIHTYDAAGNVQTYTNRAGASQAFSYDNRNRQTSFTWTDGTSSQTTVYDAASRKTQIANSDATLNFAYYDDNTLQTQEEWVTANGVGDNVHRLVTYAYDPDGNRASVQYPSGTMLDYAYTQRNQVANIALDGQQNPIVSYVFDPSGNITARSLDNGTSSAYAVDQVNRDSAVVHTLSGSLTKRFDYAYNNVNDILAVQRDGNSNDGDGFNYDLTQQITGYAQNGAVGLNAGTVSGPQTNTTLKFDGCGNRTYLNGVDLLQPNNMNQPTDPGITYDDAAGPGNGNLVVYNGWTYNYDAQNRLRHALNASTGNEAYFYYDGLNRQIARTVTGSAPSPTPTPTPSPTPTATPTGTPSPTPTATPTPPPNQCAAVTFTDDGSKHITLQTTTTGATIFYTTDGTNPTHNGGTATGTTQIYTTAITVANCVDTGFYALAYKSGMSDSAVTSYDADYTNGTHCGGGGGIMFGGMTMQTMVTTTIFSVWDGDWAILEEYDNTGARVQGYVQGYHGLVKTLVDNVYYYQDELGSTSHIADATGALLEYYKYDLYGKPTYFNSASQQLNASTYGVAILGNGGARWMPELGLYDNRNRFMSPDLGRFLQPDPIGFKGDASNLYRYCGNDWGNRADPMGLQGEEGAFLDPYAESTERIKEEINPAEAEAERGLHNETTEEYNERQQYLEFKEKLEREQEIKEQQKKDLARARKDKAAGQNYDEVTDYQDRNPEVRTDKARQRDNREITQEGKRALREKQEKERQQKEAQEKDKKASETNDKKQDNSEAPDAKSAEPQKENPKDQTVPKAQPEPKNNK
jgi:RHS repeat-associated protein